MNAYASRMCGANKFQHITCELHTYIEMEQNANWILPSIPGSPGNPLRGFKREQEKNRKRRHNGMCKYHYY